MEQMALPKEKHEDVMALSAPPEDEDSLGKTGPNPACIASDYSEADDQPEDLASEDDNEP